MKARCQTLVANVSKVGENSACHVLICFRISFQDGCRYEAELQAWEKLEAAATAPILEEPLSNSENSLPEQDPQGEMLKQLRIEVRRLS